MLGVVVKAEDLPAISAQMEALLRMEGMALRTLAIRYTSYLIQRSKGLLTYNSPAPGYPGSTTAHTIAGCHAGDPLLFTKKAIGGWGRR